VEILSDNNVFRMIDLIGLSLLCAIHVRTICSTI